MEDDRDSKRTFRDEKDIYSFWEKEKIFSADPKSPKKPFSLLIPPPNLTGELHLGHAMQHSILDAVARFKRLQGFDVLLLPGVDHAGIQFEATFDKFLSKKNLSKQKLGREKWLEAAGEFKEDVYRHVSASWRIMGLSADWDREVFTLDEGPRKAVFHEFKTYYDAGLIYKGPYIVQWCPKDNTAIEDVEMEYQERQEKLYYVNYSIANSKSEIRNSKNHITVATTRPETIFADTAIAVFPNHPKFKKFVGKNVVNPLTGKAIPVIEDKRVEKDFGTGALKITPAHDILDYEIGKDNNLEILHAIDKNGRLTNIAGEFEGLKVLEGREKAVEKLKTIDALGKEEDYEHSVAVCERCKTVVEPLISEEWFVRVKDLAKGAISVINKDEIKFLPKNYKKILVEWLKDIHDWCISRSLWWGHRIPVWYKTSGKWKVESGKSNNVGMKVSLESPGNGWVQDEQVLDTWFSSGLWPISTLGWPNVDGETKHQSVILSEAKESQKKIVVLSQDSTRNDKGERLMGRYFPWDFEISAPEIKYLWIARMIMISEYFTDKIPFKTMFFHGMLRDLEGRKFSKSQGNGIDPVDLINQWGVDAVRMALYTYSIPGRDGRVSRGLLDERCKNFRNFGTKLRNIAKFVLELKPTDPGHSRPVHPEYDRRDRESDSRVRGNDRKTGTNKDDKQILDALDKTTREVTQHLENLELHLAIDEIYEFVWHSFADKYIEASKGRRSDAQPTLENVLKQVLILLHPFMPFATEELYQGFEVKRKSIMLEAWPQAKN